MDLGAEKINPWAKKLAKIQDNQLENDKVRNNYYQVKIHLKWDVLGQDTLEALKELSTFFTENSIRTRRNLRGEIEGRSLAINQVLHVNMVALQK